MKVVPFTQPDARDESVLIDQDNSSQFYNAVHRHKEMQISLVVKGKGMLTVGNYSQVFSEGQVYIIGANQPHIFKLDPRCIDDDEKDAHAVHIYFDIKRIPETFFLLRELSSVRKFISFCTTSLQLSKEYEAETATHIHNISLKTNLERLLGLFSLFHYFSDNVTGWKSLATGFDKYTFSKLEGSRMKDVLRYTLDNFAADITLNKIAAVAHITPQAFCKYFKQHTKKTYNSFLNEVRVNEACKKIISGSYDGLSAIAYKTGFKGASNFNRVFKKTTGMSPSDYRKEFRYKIA